MLPTEVLVLVFSYLDLESLDIASSTCKKWRMLISDSVQIWKSLIRRHCAEHKQKQLILQMPMFKQIMNSSEKLQCFYKKLIKIEDNVRSNKCRVRTLNCLDAEFDGKKVVRSTEWEKNHNYRGVYDMILNNNRLVASVYDTIQVWDMESYDVANILPSKVLDEPHCATTCFTLFGDDYLICGTQNGFIKIYTMPNGKFVTQAKRDSNYVSDVNASNDIIASVDWYGAVTLWSFSSKTLKIISKEDDFQVPNILASRENERLLDSTNEFLVSTFKCHLTCYRFGEFFRSYPAPSDIFCIGIHENMLAFGCKGNRDSPVAGILKLGWDRVPQVVYFKTRDNDPVISLSFNEKFLLLGDTNGEIHIIDILSLVFPENGEVIIELSKDVENNNGIIYVGTIRTHEYRAFIWACKTDPFRIFSGDETGKIIIHDYLMFED